MTTNIKSAARTILDAYDRGAITAPPSERDPAFDWHDAYEIAADIHEARCARGERPVGRKIGFTNRNIWPQYGATSPIWAHVYDTSVVFAKNDRADISLARSASPRLEPELAFKLSRTIGPGMRDPALILRSIEWYAPSFEIVDCHYANWKFKSADSAADQSFHWRLIVGTPREVQYGDLHKLAADIRDCSVELSCGGEVRDRGVGSNALDHPAFALAFVADILARQPRFAPLAAGEIITTGTLTAALPIHSGETWTSTINGLEVAPLTIAFTG